MRLILLLSILVTVCAAPAMAQEPESTADGWAVGIFSYDPQGRWEGGPPEITIMAAEIQHDLGFEDFKASADPDYRADQEYLVGSFSGRQVCVNCLGGMVTKTTKVTVTNRTVASGEWDLLNGRLVYATAKTKTVGEGEGQETTILELTITVLR